MNKVKPIIWGIAIITLGVIFGGNAIGLFNFNVFFEGWWTLFIIVPSAISLVTEKGRMASLAFLAAGVILLLAAQNVFSYDVAWKVILAVALILFGIAMIFGTIFHSKSDKEVAEKVKKLGENGNMDAHTAIFSGSDKTYKKEVFSGANLVAVFGGVDIDLREAIIEKDTVIRACAAFGGVNIVVPNDVRVKSKSCFFFGGIADERKDASNKGKHTIYVDATGGFGGVTITDRK